MKNVGPAHFPLPPDFCARGHPSGVVVVVVLSHKPAKSESLINEELYCRRLDFEFGGYTDVDNGGLAITNFLLLLSI